MSASSRHHEQLGAERTLLLAATRIQSRESDRQAQEVGAALPSGLRLGAEFRCASGRPWSRPKPEQSRRRGRRHRRNAVAAPGPRVRRGPRSPGKAPPAAGLLASPNDTPATSRPPATRAWRRAAVPARRPAADGPRPSPSRLSASPASSVRCQAAGRNGAPHRRRASGPQPAILNLGLWGFPECLRKVSQAVWHLTFASGMRELG